jgi:hypothetical protein
MTIGTGRHAIIHFELSGNVLAKAGLAALANSKSVKLLIGFLDIERDEQVAILGTLHYVRKPSGT